MLDPVLRSFARDLANCRLFRPDGQLPKLGQLARACARAQQCVAVPCAQSSGLEKLMTGLRKPNWCGDAMPMVPLAISESYQ